MCNRNYDNIKFPIISDENKKLNVAMAKGCVSAYSGDEFEQFVFEWLKYCKKKITPNTLIGKVGGSGDKGVDIYQKDNDIVTYYQCKQYSKGINSTELCGIITKVLYYSYNNIDFMPNKLYVVAFKSFNRPALALLGNVDDLKAAVIKNCDKSLGNMKKEKSSKEFMEYMKKVDYSFVEKVDVDDIITEYYNSSYGKMRFIKSDYPNIRLKIEKSNYEEEIYVKELESIEPVIKKSIILGAKEDYYSALCLKETDKYLFGHNEEFDKVKNEVEAGIKYVRMNECNDLLKRYIEIMSSSLNANTSFSYLDRGLNIVCNNDRAGVCHFLVNEGRLSWRKQDD